MKKFILSLFTAASIFSAGNSFAQSFSVQSDTVYMTMGSSLMYADDPITNNTSNPITINWNVVATNFPSDWIGLVGICDNATCYSNGSNAALWNGTTGPVHASNPYQPGVPGDFHLQMDLTTATSGGTYWLTVSMNQQGALGASKTETYVITKGNLGVNNVNNDDNISLYPNPATSNINVVYGQNAGVKNIAVYNIIGKVMTFYKVTNNGSANLDISNIPSGVYFIRLLDANGGTVATRKFTRQ